MVLGNLCDHMQKNEVRPYLTSHTKIGSKWVKDLDKKAETNCNILRRKQGEVL